MSAFASLAREAHPDRAPAQRRREAEAKFQELTEAVNVLTNPERRKTYDFELSPGQRRATAARDAMPIAQNYIAQGIAAYKEQQLRRGRRQLPARRPPQPEGRARPALPRPGLGARRGHAHRGEGARGGHGARAPERRAS